MRRFFVAFGSAVLAVIATAVGAWTFLVPPPLKDTIILCMCIPPRWHPANSEALLQAKGWVAIDTGAFHLYGPPGLEVRPQNSRSGRIDTPRFTLVYEIGAPGFPAAGQDVVDEPVRVDGARAILRRASLPGASEPYFAGLFVPQATGRRGKPVSLLVYGVFRTRGERAAVDSMLTTVSFRPLSALERVVQPAPVRADPPVFDIEADPA